MTLRETMSNGGKICGTFLRIVRNPAVAYLAKNAGLDFVLLDCEHGDYTMETIHDIAITTNALSLPTFIRVPDGTKDNISRALDSGVTGIMVPTVESKEQAKEFVNYAKYTPIGLRGFTANCGHTDYKGGKHAEIMDEANRRVITIAQIETKKGVEHVEEIAQVEGLDVLFIGPNDLSVSLGVPGDLTNPIELDAIRKVADTCKKYNKFFGMHSGEKLLKMFGVDLQMVCNQLDISILTKGFHDVVELRDRILEGE